MNEDYFIEPVSTSFQEDGAAQPHRIYKRQAPEHGPEQGRRPPAPRETCGVQGIVPFLLLFCNELVAAGSWVSHEAHCRKIKGAGPNLSPLHCLCRLVSLKPWHSAPILSSQHPSMTPIAHSLSFARWARGPSCHLGWQGRKPSDRKTEPTAGRGWTVGCAASRCGVAFGVGGAQSAVPLVGGCPTAWSCWLRASPMAPGVPTQTFP